MRWHELTQVDLGDRLLDRQVIDPDGASVGKVDDLRLRVREDGRIEVTELLLGAPALTGRFAGWARRIVSWAVRRLSVSDRPRAIPMTTVLRATPAVMVTRSAAKAVESPTEQRVRRFVGRIPGAGDASL